MLTTSSEELLDLAKGTPQLNSLGATTPSGIRLVRHLGAGGMSAVFLAELDPTRKPVELAPDTPARLAIKMTQPSAMEAMKKQNIDHRAIIRKDAIALARVMAHKPPTEFVIGFYGNGESEVTVRGRKMVLPWIAIEYVDGGSAGTSLQNRVEAARENIDPPRALRLTRSIFEGVRILHAVGAVHRDLKPDNVLIAGPVDDETPKIADCGIARLAGVASGTFNACTIEYAGIEQLRTVPGEFNPLIGPWTDVHALASVIWFILGGETWCRDANDNRFLLQGQRRSLTTSQRLHNGFVADRSLLDRIDGVLARGAAARLPAEAETLAAHDSTAAALYSAIKGSLPSTVRYASVDAFAADLFPLLETAAVRWRERAAGENRAATAFRPTMIVQMAHALQTRVIERNPLPVEGTNSKFGVDIAPLQPGGIVFQPDGKVLAKFGAKLIYFVEGQPHRVAVPAEHEASVARSTWLARGAGGGFAVVGPSDLLLVRGGKVWAAPLPKRSGKVGPVQAVFGDGRILGLVTAGTEDSDESPELWQTSDGVLWAPPIDLSTRGEIRFIASGPFGFFAVGASPNGKSARALHLGFNGQIATMPWAKDLPPLNCVVCSAGREAWAAGDDVLVRLERDACPEEACDAKGAPAALALDLAGQPWVVTSNSVYRRHGNAGEARWKSYYERSNGSPLIGIGFTPRGAHVFDAVGGGVDIEPPDIANWRKAD